MKLVAIFLAIIVVTSHLEESRASGLGGIYGEEQRNRVGRGKVIESTDEKGKINTNNPKNSVQSANHHAKPKEDGTFQGDDGNRK